MKPLLMLHGIASNTERTFGTPGKVWRETPGESPGFFLKRKSSDSMYHMLKEKGYTPGKDLFWYSYPSFRSLPELARELRREIGKMQEASGSIEVDLLTFSLGSIISKYYAVSPLYQREIGKIIMIAPPFLGTPRANFLKWPFTPRASDLLLPGDSTLRAPWILGENHALLKKLADIPFPSHIETMIIAMEVKLQHYKGLDAFYYRLLDWWVGAGDFTVPAKSTKIPVRDHILLVEELSPKRNPHKFLPIHPVVKELVTQKLGVGNPSYSSPSVKRHLN